MLKGLYKKINIKDQTPGNYTKTFYKKGLVDILPFADEVIDTYYKPNKFLKFGDNGAPVFIFEEIKVFHSHPHLRCNSFSLKRGMLALIDGTPELYLVCQALTALEKNYFTFDGREEFDFDYVIWIPDMSQTAPGILNIFLELQCGGNEE